jgi:hypothetical protein
MATPTSTPEKCYICTSESFGEPNAVTLRGSRRLSEVECAWHTEGDPMISTNLQGVAELVIREARRQGYILPRQVRAVLKGAGVCETLWQEVLAVAQDSLTYRKGRYYYTAPVSERVRQEQSRQQALQNQIRRLIEIHKNASKRVERRGEVRIDFVQPVKVRTEDGHEYTLFSRDLSLSGIRLIGTRRLLGQKVHVSIPTGEGSPSWDCLVRILWTCAVGEDLVENGGTFLDLEEEKTTNNVSS